MKRHNYLIFFLIVIVPKTMAQEKKNYSNRENTIYENLKSMFNKPQYESCVQEYSLTDLFPEIHLTETDKSAVLDSLQKSGTLRIENDTKGFKLNMELKFPVLFNSLNNTQSISNLNNNISSRTMKLTLIESQLYNSTNQKLKVNKTYTSISFGRRISPVLNEKHGKGNVDPNYISVYNPISDSIKLDSLCTGSATYKIKIITNYDSIRCNKKDISKIIKLNGATYQIVTIEDNKVVLAILQDKRVFNELGVVSFDSIGKSLIHHVKFKNNLNAPSFSFPHIKHFESLKKSYDLIRKNPQLTIDEYKKTMSNCSKDELRQKYIFLETDSPLINDFLIYSPIYGFEKHLELKLGH
jgi:hypothetical protein